MALKFVAAAAAVSVVLATGWTGTATAAQDSREAHAAKAKVFEALGRGDYETAGKLAGETKIKAHFLPAADKAAPSNTEYESLEACGLYAQETRLECIIKIKQKIGYGGLVGQWGLVERVYFCANLWPVNWNPWGFQTWMPLGWGTVVVHDESTVPSTNAHNPPWHYSVYRDFDPIAGPRVSNGVAGDFNQSVTQVKNALTYQIKAILDARYPWEDPAVDCTNYVPPRGDIKIFQVRVDPIR